MDDVVGYICPACMWPGSAEEFQANNEDMAPDLMNTAICPECGESTEDIEDWGFS